MEIKRITVDFEVKETSTDDKYFHVKGYANTWEIDKGRDRSIKGCFTKSIDLMRSNSVSVKDTDYMALMPALWQHDQTNPIGVYIDLREDSKGLWSHAIYPKSDSFVKEKVIPQVEVGSIRKQSIGYIAEKVSYEMVDGIEVRNLEVVDLKESSLVTFPMNDGADIVSAKNFDNETALKSALCIIKTENLTESQKQEKEAINKYYEKMGRECPLKEKCLIIDTIDAKNLTLKEIESILRTENIVFSKEGCKALIGNLKSGMREATLEDQREADRVSEKIDKITKLTEKIKCQK